MERNVIRFVRDDSIGIGSDYAKVDKANAAALSGLHRRGLIQRGDEDDYTVNVWLTPKGERVARTL